MVFVLLSVCVSEARVTEWVTIIDAFLLGGGVFQAIYADVCTDVYVYVCVYAFVYVHVCVCVLYEYVCICILYMYMYLHLYMYVYTRIHIFVTAGRSLFNGLHTES